MRDATKADLKNAFEDFEKHMIAVVNCATIAICAFTAFACAVFGVLLVAPLQMWPPHP